MNVPLSLFSLLTLPILLVVLAPPEAQAQVGRVPMFACAPTLGHADVPVFQDRPCLGDDPGLRWVTPEPLHGDARPPVASTRSVRQGRRPRQAKAVDPVPSGPIALTSHRHGRRPFGLQDPPARKPRAGKRDANRRVARAPRLEAVPTSGVNVPPRSVERDGP